MFFLHAAHFDKKTFIAIVLQYTFFILNHNEYKQHTHIHTDKKNCFCVSQYYYLYAELQISLYSLSLSQTISRNWLEYALRSCIRLIRS